LLTSQLYIINLWYIYTTLNLIAMSDNKEVLQAISELRSEMQSGFRSVNKRLDGIENELRKIDTVLGYSDQYDNIPG